MGKPTERTKGTQAAAAYQFDRLFPFKVHITAPSDGSETDTGVDLPDPCIVLGVWMNVTTAESTGTTKTIDVGLKSGESNGDADGFLNGVDVSSTGIVKGTLVNSGQTLGALLSVSEDGSGTLVPEPHVVDGDAKSITYTAASANFAELVADLYFLLIDPTG